MTKLKVLSLFSGIGAFEKALENIGVSHELVGFSEIDKYAIEAYSKIHKVDKRNNLGDISIIDVNNIVEFDLMTFGFPCQDISIAGEQKGLEENSGTRSSLLWEAMRVAKAKKPKYMVAENVKNLVGKRFKPDFDKWLEELDELGYNTYWDILNAKDFGVPQNRERVFVVCIRKDIDNDKFKFPLGEDKGVRLKNVLQDSVDNKYYLSEKVQQRFKFREKYHDNIIGSTAPRFRTIGQRDLVYKDEGIIGALVATDYKQPKQILENKLDVVGDLDIKGTDSIKRVYSAGGISPTLTTMAGGNRQPKVIEDSDTYKNVPVQKDNVVVEPFLIKNATKKGFLEAHDGDGIDLAYPDSKTRRGRVQPQRSHTLTTNDSLRVLEDFKIRKLTPLECFRLMGFTDEDYYISKQQLEESFYNGKDRSDSQMYKMAGNSIVVNVLEGIFKNLFLHNS